MDECEASSRLLGSGPQWALEQKDYSPIHIGVPYPVVTRLKAYCFEIAVKDMGLVRSSEGIILASI